MKIVIIGSGNIATHLAKAFFALGHDIQQVYSKTSANAVALADVVQACQINSIKEINTFADLYLIAVKDEAITTITEALPKTLHGIVIHTSGATSISSLAAFKRYGVIYPPQSINKYIDTDLSIIPFGIEANEPEDVNILMELMKPIAPHAFLCNSQQRLALHVSAVLVNNFPNALYQMAFDILNKQNLPFDLIKPIILETATKVQTNIPKTVQTGPAVRNDSMTIYKHLQFLSYSEEQYKIYQYLSNFIINSTHK